MNLFKDFQNDVLSAIERLAQAGDLPGGLDLSRIAVEPPRDPAHGDISTNAAMVLAKPAAAKPRDIAAKLAEELRTIDHVTAVEIAGPGFINLRLADAFWHSRLRDVLAAGTAYGDSDQGRGESVNVEYVSANPTGPMHVGHGRGAVFGDALAALLEKAGYAVTREYYVNDAGTQIDVLARSVHLRYREALGEAITIPDGCYPGDYLIPAGKALAARDGDKWKDAPENAWMPVLRKFGVEQMLELIRKDLAALGVKHETFTHEADLVERGEVERLLAWLEERGLIYVGVLEPPKGKMPDDWEARPQTLFNTTAFGDDVDRPLRKSDGTHTYFASDIAYHADKVNRDFDHLIDVMGADHGGYVKRMQAAVKALSEDRVDLDIKLCQMVKLMDKGEPVKMSKRAGTFVTLREVIDEVGKDVVRFIMLTRKNDAPLDFDLTAVREQSKDNPVFYVQYAHARVCSVLRHAGREMEGVDLSPGGLAGADLARLTDPGELGLIKLMAGWPRAVEQAAEAHEPHRIAFYLGDLAAAFHGLWTRGKDETHLRFLVPDDTELTRARLALLTAVKTVVASGLTVFGVDPVEEMT